MLLKFLAYRGLFNVEDAKHSRLKSSSEKHGKRIAADTSTRIFFWIEKLISLLKLLRIP
jgi:hypothetical protein